MPQVAQPKLMYNKAYKVVYSYFCIENVDVNLRIKGKITLKFNFVFQVQM